MTKKPDVTKPEDDQTKGNNRKRPGLFRTVRLAGTDLAEARGALERLRRIGETLPAVDAAAVVREGRDAAERGRR